MIDRINQIKVVCPFYWEYMTAKPALESIKDDPRFYYDPKESLLRSTYIHEGRNALAQDYEKYKGILWVDSDIGFTHEMADKLISHDKDIVTGAYKSHNHVGMEVWDKDHRPYGEDERGFKEVGGAGFGFIYTSSYALEHIGEPLFYHPVVDGKVLGEDVNFCNNARLNLFPIWCDFDVRPYHRPLPDFFRDERIQNDRRSTKNSYT